ncbi:UvrD-helicase domain-containing protein [Sphaerisporangium sp. NPDC004334]
MNEVYAASPTLTAEQQAVVDQPADARMLVTAGAGAGKTHTLVRRLDRLVQVEDLSAGEILVLTFSRAAVRELLDRLGHHGDAARHVRAQTFDSWALDLLTQVDASGDWPSRSFEARIDGARQAIDNGLADDLYEEDLRHVVIDEVQDLVGARRDLVEALLDRFDCGFTVVGDPAQSIYGFTVRDPAERAGETNRFFTWLRAVWGEDLVELELTENFRARTSEAKTALRYGPALRALSETAVEAGQELYTELRSTLRDGSLNIGVVNELVRDMLVSHDGTTAILCRTNGQALVISEQLHATGVPHRVQRSTQDRAAPAWLALLLMRHEGSRLSRSQFHDLLTGPPMVGAEAPDRLWRLLSRMASLRGGENSLDLQRLRAALAARRLPDELTAQPASSLVVSSCHRAKGLEFDRVLIVDPGPLPIRVPQKRRTKRAVHELDPAEEARLMYVAMTRPREELYWLDALDMRHIRVDDSTDRWARYHFQYWRRGGLEIIGGDVHSEQPAGMRDFAANAAEVQDYLSTKVAPGDEVLLQRLGHDTLHLEMSPPYLVMHDDHPIGTVSDRFRRHLYRHLQTSKNYVPQNWPSSITGIRIDAVEAVAGSHAAGIEVGLGAHGVWLAPRLVGLSHFTWDKKVQEEHDDVEA